MVTRRRSAPRGRTAEVIAAPKKSQPFAFVLEELDALEPYTKPMFGCTAVYVGDRILLVLRERPTATEDNGVWLATSREHHASLRTELPSLRSIGVLADGGVTGWQSLPADGVDFEEEVLRACALVRAGDPRIGKIPKRRTPSGKKAGGRVAGSGKGAKTRR
ncbi:hypothetical protein BH11MYX4_BH11MYX4_53970 [soil metagenome]